MHVFPYLLFFLDLPAKILYTFLIRPCILDVSLSYVSDAFLIR
jgi:hypothetical protein